MTQRLSSAKESSGKPPLQSHEDLARKLQVNICGILYGLCLGFSLPLECFKFVNYYFVSWLSFLLLCKHSSNTDLFFW